MNTYLKPVAMLAGLNEPVYADRIRLLAMKKKGVRNFSVYSTWNDLNRTIRQCREGCMVVMEDALHGLEGLSELQRTMEGWREVRLLLVVGNTSRHHVEHAQRMENAGLIFKHAAVEEVNEAINQLIKGVSFDWLRGRIPREKRNGKTAMYAKELGLTRKESEVLELLLKDMKMQEILMKLQVSSHTLKSHRKSICRKLKECGYSGIMEYVKKG